MPSTENSRTAEIKAKLSRPIETYTVPWQNKLEPLPVINLSVDSVVLNPRSHRIRSQIESHSQADILEYNPFSLPAQEIIATILSETAGFDPLEDNLKESGQIDAGIVTHKGVLVNGNTRAVALRRIGEAYIRVAVLPDGATEKEITELEARLQLARDYKQDYTPTNELLFIFEQINAGTSEVDLALLLGKAQSRKPIHLRKGVAEIRKSLRILQHIREIQQTSEGRIPLTFFDPHESALNEADSAYAKLRDRDPQEARRVRDGRIVGVLVGVTYRNSRHWDTDEFLTDHVEPQFHDHEQLLNLISDQTEEETDNSGDDDGLEILTQIDTTEEVALDPTRLLATVAGHYGRPEDFEVAEGLTRGQLYEEVYERLTQAAEDREQEKRDQKRLSTPIKLLYDARQKVKRAHKLLDSALGEGFKRGKFNYQLRKLRQELNALSKANDADT